jgi:2-oxoglutarate ferredoxin oxidoreductase subunit alpha
MSEVPGLVVSQQRWGPGDGSLGPGGDSYGQATRGSGHGDFHLVVLAPSSAQEIADHVALGFELSERYGLFVVVLGDHLVAQTAELYETPPPAKPVVRPSPLYGSSPAIVPEMAGVDSKGGEFHAIAELARRWEAKYEEIRQSEPRWDLIKPDGDIDVLIVAYGSMGRIAAAAIPALIERGVRVGVFRPITLWPFPEDALAEAAGGLSRVVVAELSMGQMVDDVRLAIGRRPDAFVNWLGGEVPSPEELAKAIASSVVAEAGNRP